MLSLILLIASFPLNDGQPAAEKPLFGLRPGDSPWIWPLGGDVYEPRRLLNTHGQLVVITNENGDQYRSLHRGIDIQAEAGEKVRAITDGVVYTKGLLSDDYDNFVVVAPSHESDWGILYLHMDRVFVFPGQYVPRGLVLGTVAEYAPSGTAAYAALEDPTVENPHLHYTHLHLSIVDTAPLEDCGIAGAWTESNPLPFLSSRSDFFGDSLPPESGVGSPQEASVHSGPTFEIPLVEVGTPVMVDPPILFFQVGEGQGATDLAHDVADPADIQLEAGHIAMVVRVSDFFPSTYGVDPKPLTVMPQRIGVTVRRWVADYVILAVFLEQKPLEVVYSNEFDFKGPFPDSAVSATYLYPGNAQVPISMGGEEDHDFYFNLCATLEGHSPWHAEDPGTYLVEVTAEDVAGNIASVDCLVKIN